MIIINQKVELILSNEKRQILKSQSRLNVKFYNLLVDKCINNLDEIKKQNFVLVSYLLKGSKEIINKRKYFNVLPISTIRHLVFKVKKELEKLLNDPKYCIKYKSQKRNKFIIYYEKSDIEAPIGKKILRVPLGTSYICNKVNSVYIDIKLSQKINTRRNGSILNYRIIKKYRKFYLIICIAHNQTLSSPITNKVIALDPNHKNLFVAFDNTGKSFEFTNLYQIKYFDKIIDNLKTKRDKSKNGYKTKARYNKALQAVYHKRNAQISSALYTICHYLIKNYDSIAIGDYTSSPKGIKYKEMRRKMINQTIISKFRKTLEYVALTHNKQVIIVNERYTTQKCSNCGNHKKMSPSQRIYICSNCGKTMHRDINSAINIGKKANLLSNSDYDRIDLSKVSYIVNYRLKSNSLEFTN